MKSHRVSRLKGGLHERLLPVHIPHPMIESLIRFHQKNLTEFLYVSLICFKMPPCCEIPTILAAQNPPILAGNPTCGSQNIQVLLAKIHHLVEKNPLKIHHLVAKTW